MKKRILCYGDSNTWGYVAKEEASDGQDERYPENIRWTSILAGMLGEDFCVVEEGLCGRTTKYAQEGMEWSRGDLLLPDCLMKHRPLDAVVLMLGSNDLKTIFGIQEDQLETGMECLIDIIKKHPNCAADGNDMKVLIISPIHLATPSGSQTFYHSRGKETGIYLSTRFAGAYERIAMENGYDFLDAAQYARADRADGLHMEAAGHQSLASAISHKLKNMFGENG